MKTDAVLSAIILVLGIFGATAALQTLIAVLYTLPSQFSHIYAPFVAVIGVFIIVSGGAWAVSVIRHRYLQGV